MAEITSAMKREYRRQRLAELERGRDLLGAIGKFADESGLTPLALAVAKGEAEMERFIEAQRKILEDV